MVDVTVDDEKRLYVIPTGPGYSCLGFDECEKRIAKYTKFLGVEPPDHKPGTKHTYYMYLLIVKQLRERWVKTGERCTADLIPELIGLEGRRVELTYPDGEKTRFKVGRSTGWLPCHIELKNSRSHGGGAVYFPEGTTVRVIK